MATPGLASTELEQQRFFEGVREGYRSAAARAGETVRDFRVAGTFVRLRFAGEALVPTIVPGIAHPLPDPGVANPAAATYCEICLWDSESTGVALTPPPRPREDLTGRGNIWGFESLRYRSAYQWGEGSVSVMDRQTGQAVYWVPSHRHLPAWVLASPLRTILHWWLELNGRQFVHAAAVGHEGRGVLIPGRSGAGKSSTSLACLVGGLEFISDDYLALALDPEPRVYRVYSTAKLDPKSLSLYPELAKRCRAVREPGFDKTVFFLEDGYSDQLRESLPLRHILKPRIAGVPETRLGPAEPLEIERALASETLAHLPLVGPSTVDFLERISSEIPSATIHLGTDRARIPDAIREVMRTPPAARGLGRRTSHERPFISIILHFREPDSGELRSIAANIEAQGYPRAELLVSVDGAARGLGSEIASLPGTVHFLPFEDRVPLTIAWNRSIRESLGELLIFLEPGDRFPSGSLDLLAAAAQREPGAAGIRGRVAFPGSNEIGDEPLRGSLIRKSAFRECGLFEVHALRGGCEYQEWIQRASGKGLAFHELQDVILQAARGPAVESSKLHLRALKAGLDQRRKIVP